MLEGALRSVSSAPPSVLIIERDDDARLLLGWALELAGGRVALAGSFAEARAALENELPMVIISGIRLPDGDGHSFVRSLRESTVEARRVLPAIALTGSSSPTDKAAALREGFNAHLTKPVDMQQLLGLLREFASKPATAAGRANAP